MPIEVPDECTAYSSDTWDAMAYAMSGLLSQSRVMARARRRLGRWRGFGKPMFTIKGDDSAITWDHEAMAKRPFRGRTA